MIAVIISLILWIFAAFCSAVMDTIVHHWPRSVFAAIQNEPLRTWLQSDWLNKGNYLLGIYDGWHTFKALMILSIVASILTFPDFRKRYLNLSFGIFLVLVWWLTFEIFYSSILLVVK